MCTKYKLYIMYFYKKQLLLYKVQVVYYIYTKTNKYKRPQQNEFAAHTRANW
jgi:hypothetical protein